MHCQGRKDEENLMATIRDIAKEAGVSTATVSRVLNDSAYASAEVRQRVMQAADKFQYHPSERASKPTGERTILTVTANTGYWSAIFDGIAYCSRELGYVPITYYIPKHELLHPFSTIEKLLSNQMKKRLDVVGLILNTNVPEEDYRALFARMPVVLCGQYFKINGAFSVSTDNFQAAIALARRQLDAGCRRPVVITKRIDDPRASLQNNRIEGFQYACAQAGVPVLDCMQVLSTDPGQVVACVDALLDRPAAPDLLLFTHAEDVVAFRLALAARGVRVPEDMRIAGFDLDLIPGGTLCGADYVKQDFSLFGYESVRLLDRLIQNKAQKGQKLFVDYTICPAATAFAG